MCTSLCASWFALFLNNSLIGSQGMVVFLNVFAIQYHLIMCNVTRAQHFPIDIVLVVDKMHMLSIFHNWVAHPMRSGVYVLISSLICGGFAFVHDAGEHTHRLDRRFIAGALLLFNWTCCYRSASLSPSFKLLSGIKITLIHRHALNTNFIFNYWWILLLSFFCSSVSFFFFF